MDAALFIAHFPEFSDTPEPQLAYWAALAEKLLPVTIWGELWAHGVELWTAHHLVLALGNSQSAAVGGLPGGQQGGITSKAVDRVSVSYDVTNVSEPLAGAWNETNYGRQFTRLARIIGAGGRQL